MVLNGTFAVFVGSSLLLLMSPGPDFVYVMTRGIAQGRAGGLLSAVGISLGLLAHTVFAALGLTALLATSDALFVVVKVLGAAYLLYLGARLIRNPHMHLTVQQDATCAVQSTRLHVVRQGMLTNLLNPKAVLTFMAFIPQFINHDASSVPQIAVLGVTLAVLGVLWFSLVGYFAGALGRWLTQSRVASRVQWATGGVLVVLGLRLLAAGRQYGKFGTHL